VLRIASDGTPITVNTASASISRYQILADGSLSLLPGATSITNPEPGSAVSPFDARLDPTGSFLYVVDAGLDAVSGGSLTELSSSPTSAPAGATPFGIVVT
jgi:6-phosphogluconolactonase (cycloisomerase 2 family)